MKDTLRNRLLLVSMATLVLIADQLSKSWVVQNLPIYVTTPVIPWLEPILTFTHITNTGVAFGLLPQLGWLFKILPAVVVVLIFIFQNSLVGVHFWVHLSLGIVTGGALGNLVDRFSRGSVVDFLAFNFWPLRTYPVFNIADSAIVVGVAILLLDSILFPLEQESNPSTLFGPHLEDALNPEDKNANA